MSLPPKAALKAELVRALEHALATAVAAHQAATEGATHAEAKPENDKDTRALEASYVARGQAVRVEELRTGLAAVQALALRTFGPTASAALSALVTVDDGDDGPRTYLLAPDGGGATLGGGAIQVITPRSPLGRALVGKRVGDDCTVVVGGRTRELEIVAIV
jgi:transcription elongation GreA/GreB family factor